MENETSIRSLELARGEVVMQVCDLDTAVHIQEHCLEDAQTPLPKELNPRLL